VYIVRCVDNSLYVGHTQDIGTREQVHNEGLRARYTALRRPVRLVYSENITRWRPPSHAEAMDESDAGSRTLAVIPFEHRFRFNPCQYVELR
jgi:hypothetical protein